MLGMYGKSTEEREVIRWGYRDWAGGWTGPGRGSTEDAVQHVDGGGICFVVSICASCLNLRDLQSCSSRRIWQCCFNSRGSSCAGRYGAGDASWSGLLAEVDTY